MKRVLMSLVAFVWRMVAKMVLYPSIFILLLSSYIVIIKIERVCSRDSHAYLCHDTTSIMLYRWGCMIRIICSSIFFLHTFAFHSFIPYKGSSLSHLSIQLSSKTTGSPLCFFENYLANSFKNLAFLFLVLVRGLHLVIASVLVSNSHSLL